MSVASLLFTALLVAPWLWPFTSGPMAPVLPYLVSVASAAILLLVCLGRGGGHAPALAARGWLTAALVSSGIGLLQYFNLEGVLHPWVNTAEPGTAFGNLRQPNQLATLLVIGLLALRWQVQTRGAAIDARPGLRVVGVAGATVLLMAGLAASASRIGLVELAVLCVVATGWAWVGGRGLRATLAWVLAAAAMYAIAALVLPAWLRWAEGIDGRSMVERLQHGESTCGSRLILWHNVVDLIREKPWTGWGWGDLAYAHYIHLYDGPRFCHILDNAHNLPLHLAVELGVPLAALVCGVVVWLVWRGKPWAEMDPTRQLAWGVLLALGLHSLVEYPLWYGPFQIALVLCIWMLCVNPARSSSAESYEIGSSPSALKPSLAIRLPVAALMLAGVAYAAWDYHRISQIYVPYDERSPRYRDDAMGHAKTSWLFADVVRFAEVTTRPATHENAPWMLLESLKALHFSPEPRVITKVIESAALLGRDDLAVAHLARFKAAFPGKYQQWSQDNRRAAAGAAELQQEANGAASGASD